MKKKLKKGRKAEVWEVINYFSKQGYIYEDSFDSYIYANVMKEAMFEMKDFSCEENFVM